MPFISGNIDCQHVLMPEADILNVTWDSKLLVKIVCRYFNVFIKKILVLLALFSDFVWWHGYNIHAFIHSLKLYKIADKMLLSNVSTMETNIACLMQ